MGILKYSIRSQQLGGNSRAIQVAGLRPTKDAIKSEAEEEEGEEKRVEMTQWLGGSVVNRSGMELIR